MSARHRSRDPQHLPAKSADTSELSQSATRPSESVESVSGQLSVTHTRSFQGPLPPPDALAKYNDAFPGCAERIVAMAEQQLTHRHNLESRVVDGKLAAERTGQKFGFALVMVVVLIGGGLLAYNKDVTGLSAIVVALVSLVTVFVYGRSKDAEERRHKRADFSSPQLRLPYEDADEDGDSEKPLSHQPNDRVPPAQ